MKRRTVTQSEESIIRNLMINGKEGETVYYKGGIYTVIEEGIQVGYRRWVQIPLLMELGVYEF